MTKEQNRKILLLHLRAVVDTLTRLEPKDFTALSKEIENNWPPRDAYIAVGMLDQACSGIEDIEQLTDEEGSV